MGQRRFRIWLSAAYWSCPTIVNLTVNIYGGERVQLLMVQRAGSVTIVKQAVLHLVLLHCRQSQNQQ